MSAVELIKSIEARKLNPRSRLPLREPAVTIAYAAILEKIEKDRDLARFTYLGELYQTNYQDLVDASRPIGAAGSEAEPATAPAAPASPDPPEIAPATPAPPVPHVAPAVPPDAFGWESINSPQLPVMRARVPGGWLVSAQKSGAICFYPDPGHKWTGSND